MIVPAPPRARWASLRLAVDSDAARRLLGEIRPGHERPGAMLQG